MDMRVNMAADAIAIEQRWCAKNYKPLPVVISRAQGVWMWDADGARYLDMMSAYSAVNLGHSHPRVVNALIEQAQKVAVISRAFHSDRLGAFLARICELTGLDGVCPMNTGAEAVETAIKAARRWAYKVKGVAADRAEIIVAKGNFHGRTTTIVGFSSEPEYKDGFGPFAPGFREVAYGDAEALEASITPETAAILLEPIQGEAGIVVPPAGYLARVREICDRHNVLMILDEIQSGLGRTGKWFAYQHEGITPDGLCLGKALGGGVMPVSAFVARKDVIAQFVPGNHGSTFGGNPLAAAVGLEALNTLADEGLVERSAELGEHMMRRLSSLNSPLIGAVRGRGLWVGVEIDPARARARTVCEELMRRGVLSKETHETVIRFAPPLVITQEELDWAIDRVEETLRSFPH
ncbi:MAG: ornithine--oxo-acid transaminase [Pseudomonadota bacterium]|jgi:ornithine--oxo-acid transaminase